MSALRKIAPADAASPDAGPAQHGPALVVLRPRYVRPAEAMAYLGMSTTKFYERVAEGHFEIKRDGQLTLVSVASLDAYLDRLPDAKPRENRKEDRP